MFVDSHCHLDRLELDKLGLTLEQVIANAQAGQVQHMLCVCVSLAEFDQMQQVVAPYPMVSVSCGEHPLHQNDNVDPQHLLSCCQLEHVVAVGETGLDYFYSPESKLSQQQAFVTHIEVANQVNKPLIIHTRDARSDTLALMRSHNAANAGGVLHCFTENWEMAKAALDMGFYISISGIMTFRNATELRDVVKKLPLDRLLIETDSPYLAPVPYRGKTNQPAYVTAVADAIAQVKNISVTELADATTANFYSLFNRVKRIA
ncbi:MAG: metal-dependent hydrolase [Alteromonadaceae bacterium]|uniref:TatD family hydrolase n=1 Tax=Rheinheimera TaxID=67575 RepID=UPI000C5711C8|nr:YchF/TatD family DNA exonuclease [Rheinheimera aquimaris]MBJ91084.1 metal-dependent hydrolase [Alteromonadaceae bacterium]MCD1599354.1 YchF/TatD family DNA exonuclease [Rheinheimera aquimaris]